MPHIRSLQKTLAVPGMRHDGQFVKPITSSCFLSPGMVLTTHTSKTAEENVKSQIEGTITVRWQVHCAHQEASPFSLSPVTPRSRCLQPSLQGADKVPYRDWHSVHDLELPCHCKRAGIDDLTSSTLTGVVRHDLELPCHCERAGIAPAL